MKKIAFGIAVICLAGCAQFAASGATSSTDMARPDWLRDPARGEYPYSLQGLVTKCG